MADELARLGSWRSVNDHLLDIQRTAASHDVTAPQAVFAALRESDGMQATAALAAEFLARQGLVPDDTAARLLAWRQRHRERIPDSLRPAVDGYIDDLINQQRRAVLYGNPGLSDRTVNNHMLYVAQLADHITGRGITDWASVSRDDVETFLTASIHGRLATVRHFFSYARRHKVVLVNPTLGIRRRQPEGDRGRLLTLTEQRQLLRRWTNDETDPRERVVGLLCLIHAASNTEVRHLKVSDIDIDNGHVQLGHRPQLVPLDPPTAEAIKACLAHRLDPRVVAEMIGITKDAALHYLTGSVDHEAHVFGPTQTT